MKLFQRVNTDTINKTLAIYRQELSPERKRFILSCVFVPLQNILHHVTLPLLISFFTQSLLVNPHNLTTPIILLFTMLVVSLSAIVAGHIGFIALFNHEERMHTLLVERALRGLLSHSHTFFANSKVGSLAGDVATFAKSYQGAMDAIFLNAIAIIVNFVVSLIIIAFVAPLMLPVLFLMTAWIVYDALRSYSLRGVHRKQRKEMTSRLYGIVADALGNQTLVRMFGRANYETKLVVHSRQAIEKVAEDEIAIIQKGAESRMAIMFSFQIIIMAICMFLLSNNLLTIAAFIFIITYLGRVSSSMLGINSSIRQLEQAFLDAAKITEILDQNIEIKDAPHAPKIKVSDGEIEFKNVTFTYKEASEKAVFNNLNLKIKSGESVGLVGKSGGGKSTLTHLLLRYMDIDSGEILIDGQNIAKVTQDSLRNSIAYVPQDPFLFHRSLRENIAYGKPNATDEEIIAAAKAAHAMEFIDRLPGGFDTIVGERGIKLSGGQRQRIAIARAILKDAPILMLDEATSALDSESEAYIQQALTELMKGRTSIVIAHRLSTIAKLDRIIVIDEGKIVEHGSHRELLENNKIYAKLWLHQGGGFIDD